MGVTTGDCFASKDILGSSRYKGDQSGTSLLGKIAEAPILLDYLSETHRMDDLRFASLSLILGTDWWDYDGYPSYVKYLLQHHKHLRKKKLDKLIPEPARPDILTTNGPAFTVQGNEAKLTRNEFYEIKPDTESGIRDGELKLPKLIKFYKDYALPYKAGSVYPKSLTKSKRIQLPLNRAFVYLARIFIRLHGIKRVLIYLSVRRAQDGLLYYKVCIEIETEDERKQKALARAAAKHLYATYVVTNFPEKFKSVEQELGDYSYEGEKFPKIHCAFDVIDDLRFMQKSIEEQIYLRGIGLPGETYFICCDEEYYQEIVRQRPQPIQGTAYLWDIALSAGKRWINYAPGSVSWAQLQPYIEKGEKIGKEIKQRFPYHVEFADAVIEFARKNPEMFILIIAAPILITASVALLVEGGLLATAIIAEEAITATEATLTVGSSMGRVALTQAQAELVLSQAVAQGSAPALGAVTATSVGAQVAGAGAASGGKLIVGVFGGPAIGAAAKTVTALGMAAAYLLAINVRNAYAQTNEPSRAKPEPDPQAVPVAYDFSRLLLVKAMNVPQNTLQLAVKEKTIDLNNYAEISIEELTKNAGKKREKIEMRYLGKVIIT